MSVLRKLRFYPVTILLKPEPVLLFGETAEKKSNYKGSQIQLLCRSLSFSFLTANPENIRLIDTTNLRGKPITLPKLQLKREGYLMIYLPDVIKNLE